MGFRLISLILFASISVSAQTITEEITACDANRAITGLQNTNASTCSRVLPPEDTKMMCDDPVGYICSKNPRGRLFDSKCKVSLNDPKDAAKTPESIGVRKLVDQATNAFLTAHKNECRGAWDAAKCDTYVKGRHSEEIAMIQKKIIYAPEKMKRFQDSFASVKAAMIDLIQTSTTIPESSKALLLKQINATTVADPLKENESCYVMGAGDPDTGLFNEGTETGEGSHQVHICAGRMAALERMNDNDLLLELGHELTHSIDPCALDRIGAAHPDMQISGDVVFGAMAKCLRGGAGPRGCEDGAIHCNDPVSISEYCTEVVKNYYKPTDPIALEQKCLRYTKSTPNCPWYASNDEVEIQDLSKYRNAGHAIDQTQEVFSDFIGSQLMTRILSKQAGSDSALVKQDAMIAISSDFGSLHGVCMSENTHDAHPPGRIRVKRAIIGNLETAKFFCPSNNPQNGCQGL